MHIGIDARFYGPAGKGLGRYVEKLIEHLEPINSAHRVTVFLRRDNWDVYEPKNPLFRKALADVRWYSLAEQAELPRIFAAARCDLFHFPHYNVPLLYRKPFVVTIHDLILSRYPTVRASTLGPLRYWTKHAVYTFVIRSAVRRARAVLTVSEHTKQQIRDTFGTPEKKVTVTYEAAERLAPSRTSQDIRGIAGPHPYLLYVGNAYPHKNIEGLLEAFRLVRAKWREPLSLILVGKPDYFYRRVENLARSLGLADAVRFPGYVTDADLADLYRHALLYVFPSFEEGFGLPPLEAMLEGAPVASSNRSCLPEVLGDAAAYFDPSDPRNIAETILALLKDPARRQRLSERGREHVARYRWEDLAQTTLAVYTGEDHA